MSEELELVFVYGTLRKGASNHFRMSGAEYVGESWVLGHLYAIDWYPGMVLDDNGIPVRGEVYAVEASALLALDEFEGSAGVGAEFGRLQVKVHLEGGREESVWVYEYLREPHAEQELVPADWLVVHRRRAGPVFASLTMGLLPLAIGFSGLVFSDLLRAPSGRFGMQLGLEVFAILAPLGPVVTARLASKRNERWVEGAEVCAAFSLLIFATLVVLRVGFAVLSIF